MRTAEVYRDNCWVSTEFDELKKGDTFKLFEPDGIQVVDAKGHSVWVAASDPYLDLGGVLTIDIFVDSQS